MPHAASRTRSKTAKTHSIDLSAPTSSLLIAKPSAAPAELRLEGYSGGKLAANRVLSI